MASSLELNPELLSEIKKVFIRFIYMCLMDQHKATLFISCHKIFIRLGYIRPVYEDIADAIMKAEATGKEEESLVESYHLSMLGITGFFSDIEKKFQIPIQTLGKLETISFKSLHDLIQSRIQAS